MLYDRSSAGRSVPPRFHQNRDTTLDSTTGTYWDALSNPRQTTSATSLEFLYNPEANRLNQIRDLAAPQTIRHTYQYDAAGFVTDRDGVALGYDATGAIATIGSVAAFDHDLDGRPISRTLNGTTKHFRFGGAIANTPSGNPIEMDLGEVVIKLDGTGNRFRHMDFRGNVMFVSKANTIEGTASYRSFGRLSATGNLGERGFAQGFEIPSLGLVVLGPRVLDSDAGRFLSQDPVFNAMNLYTYAQGNPVFMWDPTGRNSMYPVHGLDGLNLSGLGSLDLEFGFGFDVAGDSPGGERPSQEPRGDRFTDKSGRILIATYLILNGTELVAVGFEAAGFGLAASAPTGGTSLIGTAGGAAIVGIGAVEIGAGLAMMRDTGAGGER